MRLFDGLQGRIVTAFCLSISKRAVAKLSLTIPEMDVFRILLAVAVVVNYITSRIPNASADNSMAILRQVSVIALANSLMQIAKIGDDSTNKHLLWLPWAAFVQSITRSFLIVVAISWAARTLLNFPALRQFEPEIRRVSLSLQYLFADLVAPLLMDPVLRRVVFALGIAGMQLISRNFDDDSISVTTILYNSASMTWANVVMSILAPDASQAPLFAVTVDIAEACLLSVAGQQFKVVQGIMPYVEWYIARDVIRILQGAGNDTFDILVGSFLSVFASAAWMRSEPLSDNPVVKALLNTGTVMTSSLVAEEIVRRFDATLADVVAGALLATMFFKVVLQILRQVVGDER